MKLTLGFILLIKGWDVLVRLLLTVYFLLSFFE